MSIERKNKDDDGISKAMRTFLPDDVPCENCGKKARVLKEEFVSPLSDTMLFRISRGDNIGHRYEITNKIKVEGTVKGDVCEYEFVGGVIHKGRTNDYGHYVAVLRHTEYKDRWYFVDDNPQMRVVQPYSEIRKFLGGRDGNPEDLRCNVVLYRKIGSKLREIYVDRPVEKIEEFPEPVNQEKDRNIIEEDGSELEQEIVIEEEEKEFNDGVDTKSLKDFDFDMYESNDNPEKGKQFGVIGSFKDFPSPRSREDERMNKIKDEDENFVQIEDLLDHKEDTVSLSKTISTDSMDFDQVDWEIREDENFFEGDKQGDKMEDLFRKQYETSIWATFSHNPCFILITGLFVLWIFYVVL